MPPRFIPQQTNHLAGNGRRITKRHQHPPLLGQQFSGVPVRGRDHGFARAKSISERAGGDLRFVEIRSDVEVRRADELFEFFEFDEAVVKDDVLMDFVLLGQSFETQPIGFALLAQLIWMRRPQDDVHHVGELG